MAEYRKGSAGDPTSERLYLQNELQKIEQALLSLKGGLTTTVVVPCGTLTFKSGVLTNKGTC